MWEKLSTVLLAAGVGCFALAWVLEGWLPLSHLGKIPVQPIEEVVPRASDEFVRLSEMYPESFAAAYGQPTAEAFRAALERGRDIYIAEGCWHCHSQFVRPVSNENVRFGAVATAAEYQNEMQLPQLLGTRRVGPDLSREWDKRSPDWHVAHFFDPTSVVPTSVMPRYGWFFDAEDRPNADGLAMVAYVTWLGSWTANWPSAPGAQTTAGGEAAQ